jgi:hypothetical protein
MPPLLWVAASTNRNGFRVSAEHRAIGEQNPLLPKLRNDDSCYRAWCRGGRIINVSQIKHLDGSYKPAATSQTGRAQRDLVFIFHKSRFGHCRLRLVVIFPGCKFAYFRPRLCDVAHRAEGLPNRRSPHAFRNIRMIASTREQAMTDFKAARQRIRSAPGSTKVRS